MFHAMRGLLPALVLCSVWLTSDHAHGQRALSRMAVAVGDTGARVGGEPAAAALQDALHAAIAARTDLREEARPAHARYVVTGSVTELDTHRTSDGHEVHIAVSIVVLDRGGSVRAMLSGRAGATGTDPGALTANALRAAVRSAMRPLGETLR